MLFHYIIVYSSDPLNQCLENYHLLRELLNAKRIRSNQPVALSTSLRHQIRTGHLLASFHIRGLRLCPFTINMTTIGTEWPSLTSIRCIRSRLFGTGTTAHPLQLSLPLVLAQSPRHPPTCRNQHTILTQTTTMSCKSKPFA